MSGLKTQSPSQSPAREVEETRNLDLYTPDAVEAIAPDSAPANKRKRPGVASAVHASSKRSRNVAVASGKSGNRSGPRSKPQSKPQSNSQPQPQAKTPILVIGIDKGTTHSGISYVHSGNAKFGPKTLTKWDRTNIDHPKFPSTMKFADPKNIWGFDAHDDLNPLRWFKLLLVNREDLNEETRTSAYLQKASDDLQASGKSPVEAVSIFLKEMFEHAVKRLKIAMGAGTVDSSRFHIVFTIPAIWPEYARQRMQQAVEQAGILEARDIGVTTHEVISEPEAAALATLSDLDGLPVIQDGDTTVVVDCGGGTVDIITYRFVKPSHRSPLAVHEVVPGSGSLCGEIFVAELFKELVIKKFAALSGETRGPDFEGEMQNIMIKNWEGEIRNQIGGPIKTWNIRLPPSLVNIDRLDQRSAHPRITITSEEVEGVFSSSVEKIVKLINSQIEAATKKGEKYPKYVILAGGFGSSVYLYECLTQRFPDLEVLQGNGSEPWSAISRGAVLHAMHNLKIGSPIKVAVKARSSRESIGVVCKVPYDEEQHHPEDEWFDPILQRRVVSVMKWHVEKGAEVPINHKLSIAFTRHLDEMPEKVVFVIYKSLHDQPSQRFDNTVVKVAEITVANIRFEWNRLRQFENQQGKIYRELVYRVEMHCGAGATSFSIHHRGKKLAAQNISMKYY